MLSTHQIEFAYKANNIRFPDITCQKGEHWLIMGSSGCGKTTLVHLMAGLLCPVNGFVLVNQVNITTLTSLQADKIRGKEMGIIFQTPHFIQSLTVAENLLMVRALNHLPEDSTLVQHLLDELNIGDKHDVKPYELSQDELLRLSVARAVITQPSIIIADDPTTSLDDANCEETIFLLKNLANTSGAALIVVSQDARLMPHFEHIIRLDDK